MNKSRLLGAMCACIILVGIISTANAALVNVEVTLTPTSIYIHPDDPDGSVFGFTSLPSPITGTFTFDDASPNPVPFGDWNMDWGLTWFPLTMASIDPSPSLGVENFAGVDYLSADMWDVYPDTYIRANFSKSPSCGSCVVTYDFYLWDTFHRSFVQDKRSTIYGTQSVTIVTQAVVPIPAAVWLFCSGLLGLIGIARRKNTA